MKKYLVFLILIFMAIAGCTTETQKEPAGPSVALYSSKGRTVFTVEIADTREERTKGLMFRETIDDGFGMFFIFDTEEALSFWMKNTLVPLDMIFFDSDYKVVRVVKNAQPCKQNPCGYFPSQKPAKYVLEVKAGTSDKIDLKEGDKAELII